MVNSKVQDFGPARYSNRKTPTALSGKNLLPWRTRTKRKQVQRTQSEKKALAASRKKCKHEYEEALDDARDVIKAEAIKLHEKFGQHSLDYYKQELLQDSRLRKKSCRVM